MNDSSEQVLAREHALKMLSNLQFLPRSYGEGMVQYAIERLSKFWHFERAVSRSYTVSLTSQEDSLEQWRAYCPRSGGVALGFPMSHLREVASEQGFLLAPCVYDAHTHKVIVKQIVEFHLEVWDKRRPLDSPREGISSHLVHAFIADLDRFAPLLKHSSFAAEREWRLISPLVTELSRDDIIHVPSENGIKMFRPFSILTANHPVIEQAFGEGLSIRESGFYVVLGPNVHLDGMEESMLSLIPREFGLQYSTRRTVSPYR